MKKIILIITLCAMLLLSASCTTNSASPSIPDSSRSPSPSQSPSADISGGDTDKVVGKYELHEGVYFDERVYGYYSEPSTDSSFIYCEILISNITDTSFDFSVNEVTMATDEREQVIPIRTAVFTGDGTEASYSGEDYSLTFRFPDRRQSHPVVVDMEVDGDERLEGNSYVNNAIPGYEFG